MDTDNLPPSRPVVSAYDSRAVVPICEEFAVLSELFDVYVETNSRPVYRPLPTEILETIFILCAHDHYYSESRGDPTTPPDWVDVSYVCRQWRDVALNCATLWTYLFNTSPRWTEELLIRSKQASLKLNVKLLRRNEHHRRIRFFEQVIPHLERIQDLCLYICWPDYNVVLSRLSLRAPRLEHLEISLEDSPSEWSPPSLLFGGDTPALRTLKLSYFPVLWYSLKLTSLTMLKLEQIPSHFQQSTPDFLASLRCMPNLQHLHVHDSLPSAIGFLSNAASYSFQKIDLPHLSRLLINAPVSTVIALLSCTNIPLETRIRLGPDYLADEISPVGAYTPLYSLLAQRYSTTKDQAASHFTIRSLGIQRHYRGTAILNLSTSEDPPVSVSYGDWRSDLPLQFLLSLNQPTSGDDEYLISHSCCCIPTLDVQSVYVSYPPTSSTFWTDILGRCPNLKYIKLNDGYMPNLTSPLSLVPRDRTEDQGGRTDRGTRRILAPALEKLELHGITFAPGLGPLETTNLESLCGALSARKEPHGRLTMTLCRERISDRLWKRFDMEGYWGDGRFCRAYYKENFYDA